MWNFKRSERKTNQILQREVGERKMKKYESGYCSARYYKDIRIHIKNNGLINIYTIDNNDIPPVQFARFYQAKRFIDNYLNRGQK